MLNRVRRLRWSLAAPALVVLIGSSFSVLDPFAMQVLRNITFDQFQRWSPRVQTTRAVTVVDIDDVSLQRLGQWPWPRDKIAALNSQLKKAQPAAIAYDILWSEPDRQVGNDGLLAQSFSQGGVVIGFALQRDRGGAALTTMSDQRARYVIAGASPLAFLHGSDSAVDALPSLQAAADGYGALTFIPDADGLIRRVPLLMRRGAEIVPSLAAEVLRVASHADNYLLRTTGAAGLTEIRIGDHVIPTTAHGEIWIHYADDPLANAIPAWKVIEGLVPDTSLAGQIVLVGTSAQGLMDVRFNPLGGVLPGVAIHSQIIEQVLRGGALVRPGWAAAVELLALIVFGTSVGILGLTTGALAALAYAVISFVLLWSGAWFAFLRDGLLLDPALCSIVIAGAYVAASVVRHVLSEQRHRWIKAAFSRYISPNLVAYLIKHPNSLELSGRRQECSFVFTDLTGFTRMMETIDPQKAVALLNGYLDQMTAITFAHQGTLDRIVGDAVAVMFSAPVLQANHRQRALDCALDMQRFSLRYVSQCYAEGIIFGRTRIGVHSGTVIVGNFGSSSTFDYRALGDVVNTTSRLESANKYLGTWMCVSAETFKGCEGVQARRIGRLLLSGKRIPIEAYEPADPLSELQNDSAYWEAYEWMEKGDPRAETAFMDLKKQRPEDALVRFHAERLAAGHIDDLIVLTTK